MNDLGADQSTEQNLTKPDIRPTGAKAATSESARHSVRRFRQNNPRFDYYPGQEAAAAIDALHKANPRDSVQAMIDYLVVEGYKSASGKQ